MMFGESVLFTAGSIDNERWPFTSRLNGKDAIVCKRFSVALEENINPALGLPNASTAVTIRKLLAPIANSLFAAELTDHANDPECVARAPLPAAKEEVPEARFPLPPGTVAESPEAVFPAPP